MISRQLGIKFLTGDEQFKDFEGVEFVKWPPDWALIFILPFIFIKLIVKGKV